MLLAFLGCGAMVSVGYLDPGNCEQLSVGRRPFEEHVQGQCERPSSNINAVPSRCSRLAA